MGKQQDRITVHVEHIVLDIGLIKLFVRLDSNVASTM